MRTLGANVFFGLIILAMVGTTLLAQDSAENEGLLPDQTDSKQVNAPEEFSESRVGFSLLKNIALDQKTIWTSPFHLHSAGWHMAVSFGDCDRALNSYRPVLRSCAPERSTEIEPISQFLK